MALPAEYLASLLHTALVVAENLHQEHEGGLLPAVADSISYGNSLLDDQLIVETRKPSSKKKITSGTHSPSQALTNRVLAALVRLGGIFWEAPCFATK